MISTDDIATNVYHILNDSHIPGMITGSIGYYRIDYSKEDIIIVPHTMIGSSSVRYGQINVNIHVPDLNKNIGGSATYIPHKKRLNSIRKEVAIILKKHYDGLEGYSWTVSSMDPAIKEQGHDEHFMSVKLEITVRKKDV